MARGDSPAGVVPAGGAYDSGLTKRELLAAMAMQGILANSSEDLSGEVIAIRSVCMAECLLERLSKTEQ